MNQGQNQTEAEMNWSHLQTGAVRDLDTKQTEAEKTDLKLPP